LNNLVGQEQMVVLPHVDVPQSESIRLTDEDSEPILTISEPGSQSEETFNPAATH
jgi:hypothetical protein